MSYLSSLDVLNGFVTVREVSRISGYSKQYLRRLLRNGKIEGHKHGSLWLIKYLDVIQYLGKSDNSDDLRFGSRKLRTKG